MGCWVNTKLWASLIPSHTLLFHFTEQGPWWPGKLPWLFPREWAVSAASASNTSIHHTVRSSCEGGLALGLISMLLGSALAWFLAVFERQVHQQHTARRAHEWSFIPPPPPWGKVDSKQDGFAFTGSKAVSGWLSLCWDLTGSACHRDQLS